MSQQIPDLLPHTLADIERANDSGRQPVVFVHGLWLLDTSWDHWAELFEDAGYISITPRWPADPQNKDAETAVGASGGVVGDIATYQQAILERLTCKPAIVGHAFGGLLAQILAGRGRSAATVVINPAPSRGILPLPGSALRSSNTVLGDLTRSHRAVAVTFEQFRYGIANAISEKEARELYEQFHVTGLGVSIYQAPFAIADIRADAIVDSTSPTRGPLLIIAGMNDHQVSYAVTKATFNRHRMNQHVTEIVEFPGRGHSLTVDRGWRAVAECALDFIQRCLSNTP